MSSNLIFGKYEILHRLAIGGMGEVFFAMQRGVSGFERPVILKSLLPDLAQQQDLVNQFLDEARVAATLNHPNVVSIFEVGLWNGTFFIAMEYIRGRNLSQLLRRAAEQQQIIPPQISARIIREAALGLEHAHQACDASGQRLNIVHRDISPQNIMLRDDGVTKVVDFGIASASNRSTRTATGTLKGKLAYMAPEQIHSRPVTPLVDEFALGIVFWELLSGRRLFKADNDLELIKLVLGADILRPDALAPHVPAALADVVMRMVNRDPLARYGSLGEVAEAIDGLLVSATPGLSTASFMRRLGTDDLKVQQTSVSVGDNFVISLNPASAAIEEHVDLSTAFAPVARPTSRRRVWVALAGAAAALAVLLVVAVSRGEEARPRVVAPVLVPVSLTSLDAGPEAQLAKANPGAPASLELVTVPGGALIRLDGRPLGPSPQRAIVAPNEPHYVLVEHPGFERGERELTLGEGEQRTVQINLKARKSGGGPLTPRAVERNLQPGFLTISTEPWTKVSVDGEPIGSTPINKKRLAPGSHNLVLVNEGASINVSRAIVIRPGENTKVQLSLP